MAQALELDPGVLCPRGILEAVARAALPTDLSALDRVSDLRHWQASVLGPSLLAALA